DTRRTDPLATHRGPHPSGQAADHGGHYHERHHNLEHPAEAVLSFYFGRKRAIHGGVVPKPHAASWLPAQQLTRIAGGLSFNIARTCVQKRTINPLPAVRGPR